MGQRQRKAHVGLSQNRLKTIVADLVLLRLLRQTYLMSEPPPRPQVLSSDTPASPPATSPWTNSSMRSPQRVSTRSGSTATSCPAPRHASSGQDLRRCWTTPDPATPSSWSGIDRLGRNAAEVMTTIRELGERNIVLRSLREGIDTSNATGRMVAGVLASLAELELELGRERRAAAREARRARGQHIGRPKALDEKKAGLAQRMHASGESASTIASALGVSRATVYRVLAEQTAEGD